MKAIQFQKCIRALLVGMSFWTAAGTEAASLAITVTPAHRSEADNLYPGSGSTVTTAADGASGVTVSVGGRNYGVDPSGSGERWGIQAGALPWAPEQTGFIVTNGFGPAAPGSKTTGPGHAASYLTIAVGNVQPNTLFQNVSIDFEGLVFVRVANAWAATSQGNFTDWNRAQQSSGPGGRKVSVTLPDFVWTGSDPLEVRLYGLTGMDEGAFSSVKFTATITAASPVPEPGVLLLLGIWLAATYTDRRR